MPENKRTKRILKKVGRLRQRDEVWEGTARLGRVWITPRHEPPYRPYIVMFAAADRGVILRSRVVDDAPTPEMVFEELLHAMRRPMLGAGRGRRPRVVYLDDAEHVAALAPRLARLGVRCQHRRALPALADALFAMERSMNKGEPPPGLLKIPGVTLPLAGHLYELAAEFYELAPWRWLDDRHSIEIRYPPDGRPRYVVVMGSGGEVFGLAMYDALDDLRAMFTGISPERATKSYTWFVLFFEEALAMTFDDLDAIEKYNWPVFAEHAYPLFGRTTREAELVTPTRSDVFWVEGALAGILSYVRHRLRVRPGNVQPIETTLTVNTIGGEVQVYLRLPAITTPVR